MRTIIVLTKISKEEKKLYFKMSSTMVYDKEKKRK